MSKNQTLVLKLEIDGKEALATIDIVGKKTKQLPEAVAPGMEKASGAVSKMTMAVGQMGFVMNDAQMFMVNFRMGMMGIANNIPFLIGLIADAKKEAKEMGVSFKDVLRNSIMGTGGVLLAINMLMIALQFLPQLFGDATKSAEAHKEELNKLREEYKRLTAEQLKYYLQNVRESIGKLESKNPVKRITRESGLQGTITTFATEGKQRYGDDYDEYVRLQNRRQLLEETLKNVGYEENINNRIAYNQKLREKLNSNEKSNWYWRGILPEAKDLDDARRIVNQWIESDRMLIDLREKKVEGRVKSKGTTKTKRDGKLYEAKGYINEDDVDMLGLYTPDGREKTLEGVRTAAREDVFEYEQEFEKERRELIKRWQEANPVTSVLLDSARSGVDGFFNDFIIRGESFASSWGNLWDRMKNDALMKLWQLASDAVWDEMVSRLSGAKGSVGTDGTGGGFGILDVISSIIGLVVRPVGAEDKGELLATSYMTRANVASASMPVIINVGGELSVGLRQLSVALKRIEKTDRSFS